MRSVQDTVRYTSKCFNSFGLNWFIGASTVAASDNYNRYTRTLTLNAFITGNRQFFQNVKDYSFIKFNYFAVKIHDLLYIGFDRSYTGGSGGNPMPYSQGVNSLSADRYPMYFAWDADEKFTFDTDSKTAVTITPTELVQYQGSKQLRPSSKTPISFLWRVPGPWRQFYSTRAMPDYNQYFGGFFQSLSGVKNLRYPSQLMGTHPNWYEKALPDDGKTANIYTEVGMTCYMGVTFKGRKTMGATVESFSPEQSDTVDVELTL